MHKATSSSARLLRKADQCRAMLACSHLYWASDDKGVRDGEGCGACALTLSLQCSIDTARGADVRAIFPECWAA